jgi:uncharacterized protein YqhQ
LIDPNNAVVVVVLVLTKVVSRDDDNDDNDNNDDNDEKEVMAVIFIVVVIMLLAVELNYSKCIFAFFPLVKMFFRVHTFLLRMPVFTQDACFLTVFYSRCIK